jgi:hypothetical protein
MPVDEMRSWYLAGESNAAIGRRLGLHPSKVRRVLLGAGVGQRSRSEQEALKDERAGVRIPTCEELAADYERQRLTAAEIADRYGLTQSRVQQLLRRCGIARRPARPRPEWLEAERAQRRPPELVDEIVRLYRSGLSRKATAGHLDVSAEAVDDVLRRAGVDFRGRRKLPPVDDWAHRYVDGGETAAEIAVTYSVSPSAVYRTLAAAGIERRAAGARSIAVDEAEVSACYVDERQSMKATARRFGVSSRKVRPILVRHGVLRTGFDPKAVDRTRFARRYAGGATIAELAAAFDLTPFHAEVAIRAYGLPRERPGTRRAQVITDSGLRALVGRGYSDIDIAGRYGVAVWAVVRRRRAIGLHRPPNQLRIPIGRPHLERLVAAGASRADIATMYRVGLATVTRWCVHYGIEVAGPARPSGHRGVQIDSRALRDLYVRQQWTTRQIANHLGVDSSLITFALHSHRIPVRRGPAGRRADAVVLLDALYAEVDVVAALQRHHVPLRPRAGRLSQRFPHPPPLDAALADELYRTVGLSATHIALLTGHSQTNVLDTLRRHGTPARSSGRSPWYERNILG